MKKKDYIGENSVGLVIAIVAVWYVLSILGIEGIKYLWNVKNAMVIESKISELVWDAEAKSVNSDNWQEKAYDASCEAISAAAKNARNERVLEAMRDFSTTWYSAIYNNWFYPIVTKSGHLWIEPEHVKEIHIWTSWYPDPCNIIITTDYPDSTTRNIHHYQIPFSYIMSPWDAISSAAKIKESMTK